MGYRGERENIYDYAMVVFVKFLPSILCFNADYSIIFFRQYTLCFTLLASTHFHLLRCKSNQ